MDFKEIARKLGSRGGYKTAERFTKEHYQDMQRKGVETRLKRKMLLDRTIDQNDRIRA